jgi:hypothetical protein
MKLKAELVIAVIASAALCVPAASARQPAVPAQNSDTPAAGCRILSNDCEPGYRFITDTLGGKGGVVLAAATAPDIRQTDPRALGPHFVTDTLGGNGRPAAAPGYRFTTDTLGGNGEPTTAAAPAPNGPKTDGEPPTAAANDAAQQAPSPRLVSGEGSGFDWGDAGVGAGIALGAMVLLGGSLALVRQLRHRLETA